MNIFWNCWDLQHGPPVSPSYDSYVPYSPPDSPSYRAYSPLKPNRVSSEGFSPGLVASANEVSKKDAFFVSKTNHFLWLTCGLVTMWASLQMWNRRKQSVQFHLESLLEEIWFFTFFFFFILTSNFLHHDLCLQQETSEGRCRIEILLERIWSIARGKWISSWWKVRDFFWLQRIVMYRFICKTTCVGILQNIYIL